MTIGPIATAIQRQKDRPDIHKAFVRPKGSKGYGEEVFAMVRDLKEHVPELSDRQLSSLVGIGAKQVARALESGAPEEKWTVDDNEASAAAELAALRRTGRDGYTDDPRHIDEFRGLPVFIAPPPFRDPYRRTDQSHTVPRPITLATKPFDIAT